MNEGHRKNNIFRDCVRREVIGIKGIQIYSDLGILQNNPWIESSWVGECYDKIISRKWESYIL